MKPIFEEIQPSFGNSFTLRRFTEKNCSDLPYWHFHPEYEIVFISNGRGKRRIGEHLSQYDDGDLIFLGPNLPHLGFAQEMQERHEEVVVQMKEDFLGKAFFERPEMIEIRHLFERAKLGVAFYGNTRLDVGIRLHHLVEANHFDRLLGLLKILEILAKTSESYSLDIRQPTLPVKPQEQERMKIVYEFVEQNFQRQFLLSEVAGAVSMSEGAFCRFFKKLTHRTFIDFLKEFRIAHACHRLSEQHLSIAAVSEDSGFNNLSHFNKVFKEFTNERPADYRRNMRQFILPSI